MKALGAGGGRIKGGRKKDKIRWIKRKRKKRR